MRIHRGLKINQRKTRRFRLKRMAVFFVCAAMFGCGIGFHNNGSSTVTTTTTSTADSYVTLIGQFLSSFGTSGVETDLVPADVIQLDSDIDPISGKIAVVGYFRDAGPVNQSWYIQVYDPDGTPSPEFGGEKFDFGEPVVNDNSANAVKWAKDGSGFFVVGKICGGGDCTAGQTHYGLLRKFEPAGGNDMSFNGGADVSVIPAGEHTRFSAVVTESNGDVTFTGCRDCESAGGSIYVYQLDSSGAATTFGGAGSMNFTVFGAGDDYVVDGAIDVDSSGNFYLGTSSYAAVNQWVTVKVAADGMSATSATPSLAPGVSAVLRDVVVSADGNSLYTVGEVNNGGAQGVDLAVLKQSTSDLTLDTTFGSSGRFFSALIANPGATSTDRGYRAVLNGTARIIVAGQWAGPTGNDIYLTQIKTSDGTIDSDFGTSGYSNDRFVTAGATTETPIGIFFGVTSGYTEKVFVCGRQTNSATDSDLNIAVFE